MQAADDVLPSAPAAFSWITSAGSRRRFLPSSRTWSTPSLTAGSPFQSAKSQVSRVPAHLAAPPPLPLSCVSVPHPGEGSSLASQVRRTGSLQSSCWSTVRSTPWLGTCPPEPAAQLTRISRSHAFLLPQDGPAAHPDLSGILPVCQRHPVHRHRHADAPVGPTEGQRRLSRHWLLLWGPHPEAALVFLQHFNSRSCQLVLGAGALQVVGLKTITTKNLGRSAPCWSLHSSLSDSSKSL